MTILDIAQVCAQRLQLTQPATFIGSTDNNMHLLRAMIEQAIEEIGSSFPWPELQSEYLFSLVTGQESYPLPADFSSIQNETLWNRTQRLPLYGPLDSVEWQQYKSGLITTLPEERYRVKGWATGQLFIDPPPDSTINGQVCALEYISRTRIRPKTWTASTVWTGIRYCSYNGNIYDRGATTVATTGTTPPTATDSSGHSDGSITWTYALNAYESNFKDDSDQVILEYHRIIDGGVWRFKRERGLDFEGLQKTAEDQLDAAKTKLSGASILTINRRRMDPPMIGTWSYPEGNFGL